MQRYLARKLAMTVPILLTITVLVFLMRALVPGDPIEVMTLGQTIDAQTKEGLRRSLGLDKPLPEQFVRYAGGLLKGDLGQSVRTRQPVSQEIMVRYPRTIMLAVASLGVAVLLGVVAGVVSAVWKDTLIDLLVSTVASLGVSMPSFWLGFLLMYKLGVDWQLLPVMGYGSWKHLVMPSLTLGLIFSAVIARMVRSSLLEVLRSDYIRTARAKGAAHSRVIFHHAMKNAMIPVTTIVGLQLGYLLGGAVVIEVVFAYPGVGELAVKSIGYRDFPVVQGITLVVAFTTVLVNLLVDLAYAAANPQIRFA